MGLDPRHKKTQWLKHSCLAILLLSFLVTASGCIVLALGAGVFGGYAISEDEVEGFSDKNFVDVWEASKKVLMERGALLLEDKTSGTMKAIVEGSEVTMVISKVTEKSVRVRVKARKAKNLLPNIKLAQDIYTRIFKRLKQ